MMRRGLERALIVGALVTVLPACPSTPSTEGGESGSETSASGDGDGDPSGDGDGDPSGDGDGEPATGDGDGEATGDGDGDPPPPEIPMVGEDFLIDIHEARVRDYIAFLADPEGPPSLPSECAWKESFQPESWSDQLGEDLDYPVRRVDWCDAWAFCAWSGKHLCGLIGGEPSSLEQGSDAQQNEWFRACTDDSLQVPYLYGETYDPNACNGEDLDMGLLPVMSLASCEGGYDGVFDMSGNVWEWTNSCAEGDVADEAERECRRRGGSYASTPGSMSCVSENLRARNSRAATNGIRCCQIVEDGGDGDGDPTGDGDGDMMGDGDGDMTSGDGDGDMAGDGDGDMTTGDGDGDGPP